MPQGHGGRGRLSKRKATLRFRAALLDGGTVADRAFDIDEHDIGELEQRPERHQHRIGIGSTRESRPQPRLGVARPGRIEITSERDVAPGAKAKGLLDRIGRNERGENRVRVYDTDGVPPLRTSANRKCADRHDEREAEFKARSRDQPRWPRQRGCTTT